MPSDAHKGINTWILYVALPAFSLKYIPTIQWSRELIFPAVMPLIIWFGAWLYVRIYESRYKVDKATKGGMILTGGLANTSFMGFPLIMAYFTEKDLSIAIISDQISFTVLSTLGLIVALKSSQRQKITSGVIVKKLFRFPPFLAFLFALIVPVFIDISPAAPLFDKLAATVGPLGLFSIGLQLKLEGWRMELRHITAGIIYKLLIAPAIVLLIALIFQLKGIIAQITVFEASMATMVTAGVLADEYHLNSKVSNLIVGISILFSFITTAFWWWILRLLL